uniref:Polysaccharide biosynthesis protein n=1 Tax=Cyanothece sp. (strain PCC 7425 / ATCC 29141) TaxID=395961 RepID=B8HJT0_CYAP4
MSWRQTLQKRLPQDRFIRNIGWMGLSELGIRASRLIATVILARFLSPEDYGLAAIVLTTHEFIRVFTRNGIGDKLVQADANEIEQLCITAYWLNWLLGLGLFLVQTSGSFAVAAFYHNPQLVLPIILIGCTYLVYPLGMVQTALVRRENRLNVFSLTNLAQVVADNLLTGAFALLGMGMWAIVLPKLLVAPIWVVMMYRYQSWRPIYGFTLQRWQRILGFGSRILGVEMLNTLRENIDYLLIGRLVGLGPLGVYYFAFNAGLGLSLSAVNAMGVSLYSDLCDVRADPSLLRQRFLTNLKTIAKIIFPLVILQSSLAPLYVPIVFGQKWVERGAVPILILICLSALSRPFANAAAMLFRAVGLPQLDLRWNLFFTAVLSLAILVGTQFGILGVAIAVMATHLLLQPLYLLWARHRVLSQAVEEGS